MVRRGLVAGLGVAAAVLIPGGLAAPAAHADDIDTYGGSDVDVFRIGLGNSIEEIKTTTTYFDQFDETTGTQTPVFTMPNVVMSTGTLPAGDQSFGFSDDNSFTQLFGDVTYQGEITSGLADNVTQAGNQLLLEPPLFTELMVATPDLDMFPF
jgi:hypothetical protein